MKAVDKHVVLFIFLSKWATLESPQIKLNFVSISCSVFVLIRRCFPCYVGEYYTIIPVFCAFCLSAACYTSDLLLHWSIAVDQSLIESYCTALVSVGLKFFAVLHGFSKFLRSKLCIHNYFLLWFCFVCENFHLCEFSWHLWSGMCFVWQIIFNMMKRFHRYM